MRKVVEKVGRTYEEAVEGALAELGIPREQAQIVFVQSRDTDPSRPGPEEYVVRAWERATGEAPIAAEAPARITPPRLWVCEATAPTQEEAVHDALETLGITENQADIQVIQRRDTNPLRPGPEEVTVRVWRRPGAGPAPQQGGTAETTAGGVQES